MPDKANTPPTEPFIEQLYEQVHEVLGGTNPRQAFVLSLPGLPLDKRTYEYDLENEKPVVVANNESQLVNNLFDVAKSVGGNNGLLLSEQYRSALNALSPKMNKNILLAKEQLRKLLNAQYTFDFGDGVQVSTLQKVFHYLYKQWVKNREIWAKIKKEKRSELKSAYPGSNQGNLRKNEYIEWYQANAEVYLSDIEQAYSAILAVFSINDMKILEGVLENGPGAELQEARNVLNHAGSPNPDGGKSYPVHLSPENWFEKLDTSFKYEDLLGSVEFLNSKLQLLYKQKNRMMQTINRLERISSNTDVIENAKKSLETAETELQKSIDTAIKTSTENSIVLTRFIAQTVLKTQATGAVGVRNIVQQIFGSTTTLDDETVGKIVDSITKIDKAYTQMGNAEQTVLTKALDLQKKQQLNFSDDISELQTNLQNLKIDIDEALNDLGIAKMKEQSDGTSGDAKDKVTPNEIPTGYSQVTISTKMSSLAHSTSTKSSASNKHFGVSFFFGGYSHSSTSTQSAFDEAIKSSDANLDIGMSVSKVSIERPWFNPGIFKLTSNMYNTGGIPISLASELNPSFGNASEINRGIFPSYPTAFVIARDVTIKFDVSGSNSSTVTEAVSRSASNGGGFFGFRGSGSSQSSEENKAVAVESSSKGVTIRFATPQIIGYYLTLVEKDSSVLDTKQDVKDSSTMSILQFATECREIIAASEQA